LEIGDWGLEKTAYRGDFGFKTLQTFENILLGIMGEVPTLD
jgi:hypothetical protein